MGNITDALSNLVFALAILLFFGPIVVMISIIGYIETPWFKIDLGKHSSLQRFALGVVGIAAWLAIYIPLVQLVRTMIPTPTSTPLSTSTSTPTATSTSSPTNTPTLTSSPTATATTPPASPLEGFILSKYAEIFDFDDGNTSGWKPFEWDSGWVVFEKSGDIGIVEKDFILEGHSGPFLTYPLDLESEERYAYVNRNAIYRPVDEEVIGILANIFYESDEGYEHEKIEAGFVVPYEVGGKTLHTEDYMKILVPNSWNTIVWSLYGPVWWYGAEEDKKWGELKELFGDEGVSMWPGRRLDHNKIDSIGIQFLVYTEGGPKQFKGTVYIDNIALIYRHVR